MKAPSAEQRLGQINSVIFCKYGTETGYPRKSLVRKRDGYWLSKIAKTDTDIRTRTRTSDYVTD